MPLLVPVARAGLPRPRRSDLALLNRAFGRTRFVYLVRRDVVAQAVSLLRAEQTNVWFETGQARQEPGQEPRFDLDQVHERVQLIQEHNTAWRQWFASARVRPHLVQYEDLEEPGWPKRP